MKARVSIKLALFCALSALACGIANGFIGILELTYIAEALWFVSYISAVVWTCKYVGKIKRNGKNITVAYVAFALALYLGLYSGVVADETVAPFGYLAFYASVIVCLGSVLVLIGRWIFGGTSKEQEDAPTEETNKSGGWTCACGAENTGKFCPECGAGKPEEVVEEAQPE